MNARQILSVAFAVLFASTLMFEFAEAQSQLKKRVLLKGLVGASLLLKYMKPKKGILPIPLPLPLPLPIEWEQPPVIVHPKQHHVPIPHPIPVPVHVGHHGYGHDLGHHGYGLEHGHGYGGW